MNLIPTRTALYAIGYGLLIWFEATLMIRWFGNWFFVPDSTEVTLALFAATPPLVFAVGWCFFYMFRTPPAERAAAAILICAVGLLADAGVIAWTDIVVPDMDVEQQRLFASWVAWAYGIGLLSGLWPRKLPLVPMA